MMMNLFELKSRVGRNEKTALLMGITNAPPTIHKGHAKRSFLSSFIREQKAKFCALGREICQDISH